MRQFILLALISCGTLSVSGQKTILLDSISYFPASLYSEIDDRIDSMSFVGRSYMLRDFNEPKLLKQQPNISVYRFTWTRSFHEIMIIRLILSENKAMLITKTEIRRPIQHNKKKINIENKVDYQVDSLSLEPQTIKQFQKLIDEKGFWEMKNNWNSSLIHDGAGWLLEANDKENGYKMLYRHSPGQKEQNFKDICLFLLRLTRDFDKLEVY